MANSSTKWKRDKATCAHRTSLFANDSFFFPIFLLHRNTHTQVLAKTRIGILTKICIWWISVFRFVLSRSLFFVRCQDVLFRFAVLYLFRLSRFSVGVSFRYCREKNTNAKIQWHWPNSCHSKFAVLTDFDSESSWLWTFQMSASNDSDIEILFCAFENARFEVIILSLVETLEERKIEKLTNDDVEQRKIRKYLKSTRANWNSTPEECFRFSWHLNFHVISAIFSPSHVPRGTSVIEHHHNRIAAPQHLSICACFGFVARTSRAPFSQKQINNQQLKRLRSIVVFLTFDCLKLLHYFFSAKKRNVDDCDCCSLITIKRPFSLSADASTILHKFIVSPLLFTSLFLRFFPIFHLSVSFCLEHSNFVHFFFAHKLTTSCFSIFIWWLFHSKRKMSLSAESFLLAVKFENVFYSAKCDRTLNNFVRTCLHRLSTSIFFLSAMDSRPSVSIFNLKFL